MKNNIIWVSMVYCMIFISSAMYASSPIITKATYGAINDSNPMDVTPHMEQFKGQTATGYFYYIPCDTDYNTAFGDPNPNEFKQLTINYSSDGFSGSIVRLEDQHQFALINPDVSYTRCFSCNNPFAISIRNASYQSVENPTKGKDVTDILQDSKYLAADHSSFTLPGSNNSQYYNGLFGDPAENELKELVIDYVVFDPTNNTTKHANITQSESDQDKTISIRGQAPSCDCPDSGLPSCL